MEWQVKSSNYRMRLAIVGNFDESTGKSIKAFIYESNNGKLINFSKFFFAQCGLKALDGGAADHIEYGIGIRPFKW